MRRWNGWGDEETDYPLPKTAADYLESLIGEGNPRPDAELKDLAASVPKSRLWNHASITTDMESRIRHTRGQSLPDWVALRSGRINSFPDGVAYPMSQDEIRNLFAFATETEVHLIPYGGGTSVVGHINPLADGKPVLTMDMSRMNNLVEFDQTSQLATFEAGISGPDLEATLKKRGFTLGHFPQSFEYSSLGGWIATRSTGQQSYYYGRIENLFAGGLVETPQGPMELLPHPASAAGPDMRQLILGSEGRLGIITHAILRVCTLPEVDRFYGVFFKDWESGLEAVREVVQNGVPVSMLRLSDPTETQTTLMLSGRDRVVEIADLGMNSLGFGEERSLLIMGITGDRRSARSTRSRAMAILRKHGSLPSIATIGDMWQRSRFYSAYLRNTLWDLGYAVDTLETAASWSAIPDLVKGILSAMQESISRSDERLLNFSHLSHHYLDGASIYVTFIFRRGNEPSETLRRWQALKEAATQVIIEKGATISHQHGVGHDHAPYLQHEKGKLGIAILQAARKQLDPAGILNPGKLLGPL
jgi:alkyldihydroxyacetonephosphate synthase